MIEVWILYLIRHLRDRVIDFLLGKSDFTEPYVSTTAPPTPPPQ